MTETKAFEVIGRCGLHRKAGTELNEAQLVAEWKAVDTLRAMNFPPVARMMRMIFRRQEARVLLMLETLDTKADLLSNIFQWLTYTPVENEGLAVLLRRIMGRGADAGNIRLGIALDMQDLTSSDPEALRIAELIMSKARGVNTTTQRLISEQIQAGLINDETLDQLSARVRNVFNSASVHRSNMIAQTTGTGTFEAGQTVAFRNAGVWGKRWLSERDGRVRRGVGAGKFDHYAPDGQRVALGEPFIVSGERMNFPTDPSFGASAGNVINCRCTTLPVRKKPEPTE